MVSTEFTDPEIALFLSRFDRVVDWSRWTRLNNGGRDVIAIQVAGRTPHTLKLAKSGPGLYTAQGFDGWGLMLCRSLEELLEAVVEEPQAQAA
nr:uncharacterized protein [uncultured bacterium]